MNNVTTCAKCAIYNGEGCNLSPKLYATRKHDLTCPYFLTRERAPQKCPEDVFVRMLATLEDIAEANRDEDFADWAQTIARNAVKMARGES